MSVQQGRGRAMTIRGGTTHLISKRSDAWRGRPRSGWALVIATLCAVVLGLTATLAFGQAGTWVERPDAGERPATAQAVVGTGLLGSISGALVFRDHHPDVDMFKICAGPNFSATTVGGAHFDTQLFLFDRRGVGLYANDDSAGTVQSTLPAGHPNGPNIRSEYFLAISAFDRDPVDATVRREPKLIFPTFPFGEVFGRFTDTGPITGWQGVTADSGHYRISLMDAEFLNRHARCVAQSASPLGSEHIDKN
jgi:hypothetical protein